MVSAARQQRSKKEEPVIDRLKRWLLSLFQHLPPPYDDEFGERVRAGRKIMEEILDRDGA